MALPIIIQDPTNQISAKVDDARALFTTVRPDPPDQVSETKIIFRQFFVDSSDNSDMRVDGSVTPVDFIISPSNKRDLYISTISFVISDAGATLDEFGNIGALTNGVRFFYQRSQGEIDIHPGMISNFDFVQLCQGNPPFGTGTESFRASNVVGQSEAYIPILDFKNIFGFNWGLSLSAGTTQKLVLTVNDDLTLVDRFDAIAYGFERIKDKEILEEII